MCITTNITLIRQKWFHRIIKIWSEQKQRPKMWGVFNTVKCLLGANQWCRPWEEKGSTTLSNCGFQDRTNTHFIANSVWLFHCIPLWRGRKWSSHYPRSREAQQVRPVAVHLEMWLESPRITHIVPMLEACTYAYDTLQMGIKANTLFFF